jgi:hypothetical protein
MDKTKKMLLVVFATLMVINLQFNTPLTKGMDDGFSLSQLVENVFVQESYAENFHYKMDFIDSGDDWYTVCCKRDGVECDSNLPCTDIAYP